jgi:hypothetical protein
VTAYHTTAHIEAGGRLVVEPVPFQPGADVEVFVIARVPIKAGESACPLRGKPIRYEHPTEPVAEDDWEALK